MKTAFIAKLHTSSVEHGVKEHDCLLLVSKNQPKYISIGGRAYPVHHDTIGNLTAVIHGRFFHVTCQEYQDS